MLIFVTGATSGFGEAMARLFVSSGHRVIAAGRRKERLEALRERLGEALLPWVLDVRDRAAVEACFGGSEGPGGLPEGWREVDVLVNNAGLALGLSGAAEADVDQWDQMVDTNVKGLMYCTRAALPGMLGRGRGHIVNMGSVAGEFPYPGGNVYGATKAFVYQFSLNLRADLVGTPVRVTDIQPGLCGGTEFSQVRFGGDVEKAAAVYAGTQPLTAEDVAETVAWVVSRPAHVNINAVSMMPVCQAFGPFAIKRK